MSYKPENIEHNQDKRFRVVAALIRKDSKILLTQRWPGKHLGSTWEFPGGKVEAGESDHQALHRELKEELGIEVQIGTCCFETCHGYGNREVHLLIYRCKLVSGTPEAIDVKAIDWTEETALLQRNFPPADLPFVQELARGQIAEESFDKSQTDSTEAEPEENEPVFKPAQIVRRP